MPSTFYLRNLPHPNGSSGELAMTQRRGRGVATAVTTIAAGGTATQLTQTAGGVALIWLSGAFAQSVLIADPITTINIRGLESVTSVNAKLQISVIVLDQFGSPTTILAQSDIVATELTAAETARTRSSATLTTSVSAGVGSRIQVTLFAAPTTTFGAGSVTAFYNGEASAASGDSFITFNENILTGDIVDVSPYEIKGKNAYYG